MHDHRSVAKGNVSFSFHSSSNRKPLKAFHCAQHLHGTILQDLENENQLFLPPSAYLKDHHAWFLDYSNTFEDLQGWFLLNFYFLYVT